MPEGLNQSFLYVEASEDLQQACMPDSVKRLLEIDVIVQEIARCFRCFMTIEDLHDSTIEDLFYRAPAWSKTCLFFRQQFLSLGLESLEDNSEHDLARMAD